MAEDSSEVCWNVDMENSLFHAMRGHKPAGVSRHFQMISIHDRVSATYKKISSDDLWSHLSKLYDLQALNESEIIPFPNKSGYFDVLESDLSDLCEKSFPRTPYINTQPTNETVKSDGSSKSATKPVKPEPKTPLQVQKTDVKPETKPTPVKAEIKPTSVKPETKPILIKPETKPIPLKSDTKPNIIKPETKPTSVKNDCHTSTSSSKGDLKTISNSSSKTPQQQPITASTLEPSPKRTKRTRNVPSAGTSPATPTEPPSKRRR